MATITESFNKADSTTLGPDLTWTEIQGDLQVVSNRVRCVSTGTGSAARADSDLASADHYAQVAIRVNTTTGHGGGPFVRKDSSATVTFYMLWIDYNISVHRYTFYKYVSGTLTAIGATTNLGSYALGDVFKLSVSGTTLSGYQNGSLLATRTDSSISSGTRCGVRLYAGGGTPNVADAEADDFEAGDLAAAASLIYYQPAIAPLLVR